MRYPMAPISVVLIGFLASAAWSQTPVPIGSEFQVNTYTTSAQEYPSLAVVSDGDFVVVWKSYGSGGSDSSQTSIQLRRFTSNGTPVGDDLQVNTYTTDQQRNPGVAVDGAGNFDVVWTSNGSSGSDSSQGSIQLRSFTSDGSPVSNDLQVNTYTTSYQHSPSIAANSEGAFVVVWASAGSYGTDRSGFSVQGQRFASDGTPQDSEFQVNTYTTNSQGSPDVAMAGDGDFVVVWRSVGSYGTDTSSQSIQGQRFASDGTPQSLQFQVNTYTTNLQLEPTVGLDGVGNFVVVWWSYGQDGDDLGVFGQRFDSLGMMQGSEFQVNTYTTSVQGYGGPGLAVAAGGRFVVVWTSDGSFGTDSSAFSMQGQSFAANATALGGQFQVNTYSTSFQGYYGAEVAISESEDFVVIWDSFEGDGSDTSSSSIQAQRFATPVFADGFESGDTTAWSSTQ